jgi:hypothetical protein
VWSGRIIDMAMKLEHPIFWKKSQFYVLGQDMVDTSFALWERFHCRKKAWGVR